MFLTIDEPTFVRRFKRRRVVKFPTSCPLIGFGLITSGTHTLRYADSDRPHVRRKPEGASELQVFIAITDRANAPLDEARYYGKFTKNPAVIEFDRNDDGKFATYYTRWVSRRGEHGPWSLPVSLCVAFVS